jgi:hypothetical protein
MYTCDTHCTKQQRCAGGIDEAVPHAVRQVHGMRLHARVRVGHAGDLDEAEEQYCMSLRSHLANVDAIIELHNMKVPARAALRTDRVPPCYEDRAC